MIKKVSFLAILALALVFLAPNQWAAEEKKVDFRKTDSLMNFIKGQKGKRLEIILVSGMSLTGVVETVSQRAVHIKRLAGKEFFDAVVPVNGIIAVIIKARGS